MVVKYHADSGLSDTDGRSAENWMVSPGSEFLSVLVILGILALCDGNR
jgi:hypothetical protein